uniref:Uncharacterized protein n=2 Tax=Panagrolaimus sp. ES5 TaxID=591445 RepID=A0AC34FA70_9BILA
MNAIAASLENMASPTLLETKTLDELKADVINVGLNTLTSQQKVFVTTFGAKFLGKYGNYEDSMAVATTIMMNNCLPFANQLIEMWEDYEARGKTQAQIFQRGFKMADMFMTKKRIGTIYCRLKAAFMKYDATIWPYMRQNINTIVSFAVLEGLPNACTPPA